MRPGRGPWPAIVAFVLLTLLLSGALLALQPVSGIDPEMLSLVQFGPALAAVLTWTAFRPRGPRPDGPEPVATGPGGVGVRRLVLLAVGASAAFVLLAWMAWSVSGHESRGFGPVAGHAFALVAVTQALGAFGEELGWRGLLQPQLERRMAPLGAAVVTGLVWGAWHVQVFADLVVAIAFLVSTVALSILMASLARGSVRQRVLSATLVHWLVNLAVLVIAGDASGGRVATTAFAAVAVVVALGAQALPPAGRLRPG